MVTLTDVSVGDVVISEIMHSSDAVYDYKGEWFELHNTRTESINIKGMNITSVDGGNFDITDDLVITALPCCYRTRLSLITVIGRYLFH